MASDTDSTNNDDADLRLRWSGRLDARPSDPRAQPPHRAAGRAEHALSRRFPQPAEQGAGAADAHRGTGNGSWRSRLQAPTAAGPILATVSKSTGTRLRRLRTRWTASRSIAGTLTGPTYELRDPSTQRLDKGRRPGARPRVQLACRSKTARGFRRAEAATGCSRGPKRSRPRQPESRSRRCAMRPDLTPGHFRRRPVEGGVLLATTNDRAFTHLVRTSGR